MEYASRVDVASGVEPGVTYVLHRISFGRRLELARRIRAIAGRAEFLAASGNALERAEARLAIGAVEEQYVLWGVAEIRGLEIDGRPATPDTLLSDGPEALAREAVSLVAAECGLSEEERKN
jgi:hypothetical protein